MTKPFIRWCGGKSWLAPTLVPIIREHLERTGGTYREPFLGGGAMALALGAQRAVLGDACAPLIVTYKAIQKSAAHVFEGLEALATYHPPSEASYYTVRAQFNLEPSPAAFLYLMAYGYNGVWRVNASGEYNVPWCKNPDRARPTFEQLVAVQVALRGAAIPAAQDFEGLLRHAEDGDVIFADPPYAETFDGYSEGGFGVEDHTRLARALHAAHRRGAAVFATNADTPLVRSLYAAWATLEDTAEPRKIRPHGSRERAPCVLIRAGI